MATLVELKAARTAAYEKADALNQKGSSLSETEVKAFEGAVAEVKELDAQIAKRTEDIDRGDAILAVLDGKSSSEQEALVAGPSSAGGSQDAPLAVGGPALKAAASNLARQLTGVGAKALPAAGAVFTNVPVNEPVHGDGRLANTLLETIGTTKRNTPSFRFMRQTVRENNAAIVPAGGEKPVSKVTVETVDSELVVYAHMSEYVDKYILSDAPALEAFLVDELKYGLLRAIESDIVNADGTEGVTGILNTADILTHAPTEGTDIDVLRGAMTKLELVGRTPNVIAVSVNDFEALETAKSDSLGAYYLSPDGGSPQYRSRKTLWSLPVVVCNALADRTALVMDTTAMTVDRDKAIEIVRDDISGLSTNTVRFRMEGRFNLSVFQPQKVVEVTLPSGS